MERQVQTEENRTRTGERREGKDETENSLVDKDIPHYLTTAQDKRTKATPRPRTQ